MVTRLTGSKSALMLASVKVREAQKLIQEVQQIHGITFDENTFSNLQRNITELAREVRT